MRYLYAFLTLCGISHIVACLWVGTPVLIHNADVMVSGAFHNRYERLMAESQLPENLEISALEDIQIKANMLCENMDCGPILGGMQK